MASNSGLPELGKTAPGAGDAPHVPEPDSTAPGEGVPQDADAPSAHGPALDGTAGDRTAEGDVAAGGPGQDSSTEDGSIGGDSADHGSRRDNSSEDGSAGGPGEDSSTKDGSIGGDSADHGSRRDDSSEDGSDGAAAIAVSTENDSAEDDDAVVEKFEGGAGGAVPDDNDDGSGAASAVFAAAGAGAASASPTTALRPQGNRSDASGTVRREQLGGVALPSRGFLDDPIEYCDQPRVCGSGEREARLEALESLVGERDEPRFRKQARLDLVQRTTWLHENGAVHGARLGESATESCGLFAKSCQLAVAHACQPGCAIGPTSAVFSRARTIIPSIHVELQGLMRESKDFMKNVATLSPDDRMILASIGALRTLTAHPTESQLDPALAVYASQQHDALPSGGQGSPAKKSAPRVVLDGAADGGADDDVAGDSPDGDSELSDSTDAGSQPAGGSASLLPLKLRFVVPASADDTQTKWEHSQNKDCTNAMKNPNVASYVKACHLIGVDAVIHVACEALRDMVSARTRASDAGNWALAAVRSAVLNINIRHNTALGDVLHLPVWMSQFTGYSIDTETPHFGFAVSVFPNHDGELVNLGLQGMQTFSPRGVSPWLRNGILRAVARTCMLHFPNAVAKHQKKPIPAEVKEVFNTFEVFGDTMGPFPELSRGAVKHLLVERSRFLAWSSTPAATRTPGFPALHSLAERGEWSEQAVLDDDAFREIAEHISEREQRALLQVAVSCHISDTDLPAGVQLLPKAKLLQDASLSKLCTLFLRECKGDAGALYSELSTLDDLGALLKLIPKDRQAPLPVVATFGELLPGKAHTDFIVQSLKLKLGRHVKAMKDAAKHCGSVFGISSCSGNIHTAICKLLANQHVDPTAVKQALQLRAQRADTAVTQIQQRLQDIEVAFERDLRSARAAEAELSGVCVDVAGKCQKCAEDLRAALSGSQVSLPDTAQHLVLQGSRGENTKKAYASLLDKRSVEIQAALHTLDTKCLRVGSLRRHTALQAEAVAITAHIVKLSEKVDANWKKILSKRNTKTSAFSFWTAAHSAALSGHVGSLEELLRSGAQLNGLVRVRRMHAGTDGCSTTHWNVLALLAWHVCQKDASGNFKEPDDKRAAQRLLEVYERLHPETPLHGVDFKQVLELNGRGAVVMALRAS